MYDTVYRALINRYTHSLLHYLSLYSTHTHSMILYSMNISKTPDFTEFLDLRVSLRRMRLCATIPGLYRMQKKSGISCLYYSTYSMYCKYVYMCSVCVSLQLLPYGVTVVPAEMPTLTQTDGGRKTAFTV